MLYASGPRARLPHSFVCVRSPRRASSCARVAPRARRRRRHRRRTRRPGQLAAPPRVVRVDPMSGGGASKPPGLAALEAGAAARHARAGRQGQAAAVFHRVRDPRSQRRDGRRQLRRAGAVVDAPRAHPGHRRARRRLQAGFDARDPLERLRFLVDDRADTRWRCRCPTTRRRCATVAWRETDRRYHDAAERLVKIRTQRTLKVADEDPSDDFSREKPATLPGSAGVDGGRRPGVGAARPAAVGDVPRPGRSMQDSGVTMQVSSLTRWLINSEGTVVQTGRNYVRVYLDASARADDGMELERFETFDAASVEGLGSNADMETRRRRHHRRPARAAAGAAVRSVHRARDPGRAGGGRVLPRDLRPPRRGAPAEERGGRADVRQEDRRADHAGVRVGVRRSDAGAAGRRRPERLLSLRRRRRGRAAGDAGLGRRAEAASCSAGRRRAASRVERPRAAAGGAGGRVAPGEPGRRAEALRPGRRSCATCCARRRRRQGKLYGLSFRDISGGFTNTQRGGPQAFKVLPILVYRVWVDGRPDELVRGVDLVGTPLAALSRIIAASDDYQTFNGYCGAESGFVPVSATSPSLLVQQIEVERRDKGSDKPPLLAAAGDDVGEGPRRDDGRSRARRWPAASSRWSLVRPTSTRAPTRCAITSRTRPRRPAMRVNPPGRAQGDAGRARAVDEGSAHG